MREDNSRRADRAARMVATLALAAAVSTTFAGCASLRGRDRAPSVEALAKQYGCDRAAVERNRARRAAPLAAGAPLCSALGRYGQPIDVSTHTAADMRLVSMLHRLDDRLVTVTYVYYDDTPVNRRLHRSVGTWMVQRVAASR